jgi:hypothetical protein
MTVRDVIRLGAHDGKREIFLSLTAEASKLHWSEQKALLEKFSFKQLLPLAEAAFQLAEDKKYKLDPYSFYIPNEPEAAGKAFSPKVAVQALQSGKVLKCSRDGFGKPKLTFGDKDWKPAKSKTSVTKYYDY